MTTIGVDASRGYEARPTGTENYARAVIGGLLALGGPRYVLYTRGAPPSALAAQVGSAAALRPLPTGRLWTQRRLAAAVWRDRPDALFVPAHVLPLALSAPGVVTVHDVGHRRYPAAHTRAQRAYLELTTRHHARRARALIADSAATAADLTTFFRVPPDRIHVVHLGVDPDLRPPAASDVARLRARLGLDAADPLVVHVGTRQPRKNLVRLIGAVARLAPHHPSIALVLAGRVGWGGEDLAAVARRSGVADRVHLIDYVDRSDLPALYGAATVVAVPSLHEGFGLPVLEAMACGAVVAASSTSSLPEVGGEAALYFDPLDEADMARVLGRLMASTDERAARRAAGRIRAAGFGWARCAAATRDVLVAAARPVGRRG